MKILRYVFIFSIVISLTACGVYSFTGADTGNAKTFQVNFFRNEADLVEPGLDQQFTNSLQDLIANQTTLNLTTSGGDLVYEGEIVEYRVSPTTATANNTAAQNRLTISVNVRYYNTLDEEKDIEQRFSFFFDYPASTQLIGGALTDAQQVIFDRITQDIFNATLANW